MTQKSYYVAESFDLAFSAITYSAANSGSAFGTAGVTYYTRLDTNLNPTSLNGYISLLWAKGTGTAGSAFAGLYVASGSASAGTLYQVGTTADIGGVTSGLVRESLGTLSAPTIAATGEQLSVTGVYYAAFLVHTDAQTDHIDLGRSSVYATNEAVTSVLATDPTTGGGWPRAFHGAGSSLTALPTSEAISGVTTSAVLGWFAVD